MRRLTLFAVLGVVMAGCGARQGLAAQASAGNGSAKERPALTWHFVGQDALAGNTNGARLRQVWQIAATRTLVNDALGRLASSPARLWPAGMADTNANPAPLIRPLLDDLLLKESCGALFTGANRGVDGWVAVRLDATRAALWQESLEKASALFGWEGWKNVKSGGVEFREAVKAKQAARLRLAKTPSWLVFGWGEQALSGLQEAVRRAQGNKAPLEGGAEAWLRVEAETASWAALNQWTWAKQWPLATLTAVGRGANLRSELRLNYPQPLSLPLENWRIPTNTIREPLVSFAAVRGVRPWLAERDWAELAGMKPAPNQLFGWSQSVLTFQTYAAWELPGLNESLPALATRLPEVLKTNVPRVGFGSIGWQTNTSRISWMGLPMLVPYLGAAPAPEDQFVVAGIFPTTSMKPQGPRELYSQFVDRTNLVAYHWELTGTRVTDWRNMFSFYSMLASYAPPTTNDLSQAWINDTNVISQLGNAVTEVVQTSPRELTAVRTSTTGLTGFELYQLLRWVGNRGFPVYLEPPSIGKRSRPQPGVRLADPAAPIGPAPIIAPAPPGK